VRNLWALLLLATMPLPAQTGEVDVRWVAGRPLLLGTLHAGRTTYQCHLLLDFSLGQELLLHRNAAGALAADAVDFTCGGLRLEQLAVQARRDRFLEGLTARYASELKEVPVAGFLGLRAFKDCVVVLDGPAGKLRVEPPGAGLPELPVSELLADPRGGVLHLRLQLENDKSGAFALHTRDPWAWIEPGLAAAAGHRDGVLLQARAGALDFSKLAPFRIQRVTNGVTGGIDGGIGAAMLRQLTTAIDLREGRIGFSLPGQVAYEQAEADLCRALHAADKVAALRDFVRRDTPYRHEAARALLEAALASSPPPADALRDAWRAALEAAPADAKGREALALLAALPETAAAVREELARAALLLAAADLDGTATHQLRIELGRADRLRGNLQEARRSLLAAAFGAPHDGRAHLELGLVHEAQGELERARGRYFQALLDVEQTGEQGLVHFAAVQRKLPGGEAELLPMLRELADGRVPSFHPLPREPEQIAPTGRVVLVELFTGAQCPPCAAADLAFEALGEHFRADEVARIQWHLPIPAPEPMITAAARERAQRHSVRGTPTAIVAGTTRLAGGGDADQAPELWQRYEGAVGPLLLLQPVVQLQARASLAADGDTLQLEVAPPGQDLAVHAVLVERTIPYPGRNGILFHEHVARATFTPPDGAPGGQKLVATLSLRAVAAELDRAVAAVEERERFDWRPTTPNPRQLAVVVFVEDKTRAIPQALTVPVQGAGS
jgi:tetratricopeptide (TPR) repeat protein